jgi:hypothetical protein
MTTNNSSLIQPFNDLQDQFYGIVQNRPQDNSYYTGSINTLEFDNYRDGLYLRTVNDYFKSDQVKLTVLPTVLGFVDEPNGNINHSHAEWEILGVSSVHSYAVNGDSVAFPDQIQGVDQHEYTGSVNIPGTVRYLQQSTLVQSEVITAITVYPFFVDSQNRPEFNGYVIEPFPLYTGFLRFVLNPLAAQTGIRGSTFLGLDNAEDANPLGSLGVGFGAQRNAGSVAEYQTIEPRPFVDSGADMIIVKSDGMFVGKTTQRDNDVLSPVSCSHLAPWRDEYSGKSFVDILAGDRRESLLALLGKSLPSSHNPDVSLPYYAAAGYEFGDDLNMEQTRDSRSFSSGWTSDLSYNQNSLYGTDSVAYSGYMR